MAIIKPGPLASEIRGKLGDMVFARNPAGQYVREREQTQKPETERQAAVQKVIEDLAPMWSAVLTEPNRQHWRDYAARFPTPNRLGNLRHLSGIASFIRINSHYYRINLSMSWPDAPLAPNPDTPAPIITANTGAQTLRVALPIGGYDPLPEAVYAYAYCGRPTSTGCRFFTRPWRFASWNDGADSSWYNDPWTFPYPFTFTSGQRLRLYLVMQYQDHGELSTPGRTEIIAP